MRGIILTDSLVGNNADLNLGGHMVLSRHGVLDILDHSRHRQCMHSPVVGHEIESLGVSKSCNAVTKLAIWLIIVSLSAAIVHELFNGTW